MRVRNLDINKISPISGIKGNDLLPFMFSQTSIPIPLTSQNQIFTEQIGFPFNARELWIKKVSLRTVCIDKITLLPENCDFVGRILPYNGVSYKHNRNPLQSGDFLPSNQDIYHVNDNNENVDLRFYWNIPPNTSGLTFSVVCYPKIAFGTLSIIPFWQISGFYKI